MKFSFAYFQVMSHFMMEEGVKIFHYIFNFIDEVFYLFDYEFSLNMLISIFKLVSFRDLCNLKFCMNNFNFIIRAKQQLRK